MNTHVPEEYGGPGLSHLDGALIEEELAWGCSGIQTSLGANGLASAPVDDRRLGRGQEGVLRRPHRVARSSPRSA